MINVTVGLAFVAGFLSFASPCVLPLVPAYVGYMANRLTAKATSELAILTDVSTTSVEVVRKNRFQMGLHGLAFVAGFTFVFVVFGLAIEAGTRLLSSTFYEVQRVIIPHVGGILIILFGLHFLGVIVPMLHWLECQPVLDHLGTAGLYFKRGLVWLQSALYADTRPHMQIRRTYGLLGSSLMGVIFAAGWTPCIGPIYGTMLTMAANGSESLVIVGGLMTVYSLGLGLPFVITAIALDRVQGLLRRLKRHLNTLKVASGLLMILIGILVYTGELQRISQFGSANSAVFMYKVEECTIQLFDGKVSVSGMVACISEPSK